MGSLLDNIDNTLNSGNSYVVKTKLFETFYSEILRDCESYKTSTSSSYYMDFVIKRMINERKFAFEHLTVGDLKNYFYLNELEIRQFCSDSSIVKNVQDTLYSFSVPKGQSEYYHGKYTCNLENALYALTGGTFMIEIDDVDCGKYLIDVKSTPDCVKYFVLNNVKKCNITLNPDFFKDLKDYCLKKLELL
jgi:hypothetical protein